MVDGTHASGSGILYNDINNGTMLTAGLINAIRIKVNDIDNLEDKLKELEQRIRVLENPYRG